jgi:hypothetical protein
MLDCPWCILLDVLYLNKGNFKKLNSDKARYTQMGSTKANSPWTINIHLILKTEGQEK